MNQKFKFPAIFKNLTKYDLILTYDYIAGKQNTPSDKHYF